MPEISTLNPQKIARWKVIAAGIRAHLASLPLFTGRLEEMERVIDEAEQLQIRQKALMAELQFLNRQRGELAVTGEDLRTRLAAMIQAEHGFKNQKLIEFGVKPRRRPRPRKEETEQPTLSVS
jgi:hypothetical protein